MIDSHLRRSAAKLVLTVSSMRSRARSPSITNATPGEPLQPFWGALISTSTPVLSMSTHSAPDATQSSTKSPPTACTASATARRYSSDSTMPAAVSTCGAKTTSGRCARIAATTSSTGGGRERRLATGGRRTGLQHHVLGRDAARVEDLRPSDS